MPAEKHILDQTVEDLMEGCSCVAASVQVGSPLSDAIDAIISADRSTKVYVVDESGVLVGTVTINTLMRQVGYRLKVRGVGITSFFRFLREVFKDNVEEFMEDPMSVTSGTTVVEATRLIVEHNLNDLPIVDGENHLTGELKSVEIIDASRKLFDESSQEEPVDPI